MGVFSPATLLSSSSLEEFAAALQCTQPSQVAAEGVDDELLLLLRELLLEPAAEL